ncbi:MAG: type II toxin-antitoxin system VapC family toxin [Steroidobacteraceae bacterium]
MKFWDASALVPLIAQDQVNDALESLYGDGSDIWVWWVTPVEIASSVARRERQGELTATAASAGFTILASMASTWHEVLPGQTLRQAAQRLLRVHPLRAADSLQLAAALTAAGDEPGSLEFICRDARLAEAASREGLSVITA